MAITFGVNLSVDNYWDVPEFVWRAEVLDSPAANTPTPYGFPMGGPFEQMAPLGLTLVAALISTRCKNLS